jgi:hypothetical protein
MLTQMQVLSSLLYCAASYIIISWSFRESAKKAKKSHLVSIMAIVLLFAVKMVSRTRILASVAHTPHFSTLTLAPSTSHLSIGT